MEHVDTTGEKRLLKVHLSRENVTREVFIEDLATLIDVVRSLGLPPDGVLVLRNGAPLPLDHPVSSIKEEITMINVASGG